MKHKILSIFVIVFLFASLSFALEYQGEDIPEEPHPFLKELNLYYPDNTPIKISAVIKLPDKYLEEYKKKAYKEEREHGVFRLANEVFNVNTCILFEKLTPNEVMSYIDNGCKVLGQYDTSEIFDKYTKEIVEKVEFYNKIKCGSNYFFGVPTRIVFVKIDGYNMGGVKLNAAPLPEKKPLSEIVYGK